jgi:hypothetical protein
LCDPVHRRVLRFPSIRFSASTIPEKIPSGNRKLRRTAAADPPGAALQKGGSCGIKKTQEKTCGRECGIREALRLWRINSEYFSGSRNTARK